MGYRRHPFAPGEWYHCYTRGIDKRRTFISGRDYERYVEALYLSNSIEPVQRKDLYHLPHAEILAHKRGRPLVALGAYCLMPNHVHLLLQEIAEDGVSQFMQRLGTSYTKYFNEKHERIGNLFIKPFRSKHVSTDRYLGRIVQYIHLNPAELYEPLWKKGGTQNLPTLRRKVENYPYSSLPDYIGAQRTHGRILHAGQIESLLSNKLGDLGRLIQESHDYFASLENP